MSCNNYGGLTICRTPMERVVKRPHGEPRWCFKCRKIRDFLFVVDRTVEPSYYDPNPDIICAKCDTSNGDLFPGRYREWEE